MAGLKRLGLEDKCVQCFNVEDMIPAVGQGALGIETRKDEDIEYLLQSIHDEETALSVSAERAFMIRLNGGCSVPIGAHAVIDGENMKVFGMYAKDGNSEVFRASVEGSKYDAASLGEKLADIIIERGAK
jgi:hydroxymethylbilane synthase